MYLMEGMNMMKKRSNFGANTAGVSTLAVHMDSQTISKVGKPKIRIIHIFAPEIIKTDVANFRELVQRLTGKPTGNSCTKKKTRIPGRTHHKALLAKKMELRTGFNIHHHHRSELISERIKGEEEIWRAANSGGGFLGGFADELEGFIEQLNNEFPLLPMDASSHHMDAYAQSQLA